MPSAVDEVVLDLELRGGNRELWMAREHEILVEGPAGTGKTRTILELINLLCGTIPKTRALIVRRYAVTLTSTTLVTLRDKVLHPLDGVTFFGGSKDRAAAFTYPNGSTITVGGMDNPSLILSSEYDIIYWNEATEGTEEAWETLQGRARPPGALKAQRLIGDCNPSSKLHWLNKRCDAGRTRRIVTRLTDNPAYYNRDGSLTEAGAVYVNVALAGMTGTRRDRLVLGLWVGPENAIYVPPFDRNLHVQDLPPGTVFRAGAIGVDYGRRHKSGSVPISVDQFGRRWVREAWGEPAQDDGANLNLAVGRQKQQYKIFRGRTDPLQAYMAGVLGFNVAVGSAGSRNERTKMTSRLMGLFPGGRVPTKELELNQVRYLREHPQGPFVEEDSPGLLFVRGAPGIDELCDQIEDYHELFVETERASDYVVARINDDLVAAMEYAVEELENPERVYEPPAARAAYRPGPEKVAYGTRRQQVHGGVA